MKKEKDQIEYRNVPKEIAQAAENRTRAIIKRWGNNPRSTVLELALSLYFQGVEDATKIIHKL